MPEPDLAGNEVLAGEATVGVGVGLAAVVTFGVGVGVAVGKGVVADLGDSVAEATGLATGLGVPARYTGSALGAGSAATQP